MRGAQHCARTTLKGENTDTDGRFDRKHLVMQSSAASSTHQGMSSMEKRKMSRNWPVSLWMSVFFP